LERSDSDKDIDGTDKRRCGRHYWKVVKMKNKWRILFDAPFVYNLISDEKRVFLQTQRLN